uniref:large ribosomal subunit protein mL42 n=1 Tax=Myxine glutinosa TaxID=7769 RepID=UPI00358EA541
MRMMRVAVALLGRSLVRCRSSYTRLPDDYNCHVDMALTADGETIVCLHPSLQFPYEDTQPMPWPDPARPEPETHDQKVQLAVRSTESSALTYGEQKPSCTEEQLARLFHTTKHRWYPKGRYHMQRMKKNPPKDR